MQSDSSHEDLLSRMYKVLFVPYALLFIIYIIFTIALSALAKVSGFSYFQSLFFFAVMASSGLFAYCSRVVIRSLILRRARRKSANPHVRKLTENNTLRFLQNGYVEFSVQLELRALRGDILEFEYPIGWHGSLSDLTVDECFGCRVEVAERPGQSGKIVHLKFRNPLGEGRTYPVSFALLFDNSSGMISPYLRKVGPYLPEDKMTQTIILSEKSKKLFCRRIERAVWSKSPVDEQFYIAQTDSYSYTVVRPVQGLVYFVGVAES